jgi:GT2 family glycosyltransferase
MEIKEKVIYAAFVITYKRPAILLETINKLFEQTFPPAVVLIIDNDPDKSALGITNSFPKGKVQYYAVGYNSGPAGGAYFGLKLLFEQNWDWVLWTDDDDPPVFDNSIQNIFSLLEQYKGAKPIGMIGAVGANFNKFKGSITRIETSMIETTHIVDYIGGSMSPIVNRNVFEKSILPNPDLFFGFEDLSFCLQVKKAGFEILISGTEMVRRREKFNRLHLSTNSFTLPDISTLWRQYYSVRSLFTILFRQEKIFSGLFYFILKTIFKSFLGYQKGLVYGNKYAKFHLLGLFHGMIGKNGCVLLPEKKYT